MTAVRSVLLFAVCNLLLGTGLAADEYLALCYHDVRGEVPEDLDPDRLVVSTDHLVAHFAWLVEHGYQPVSWDDILAARAGTRSLPPNPVLLTFDDGLKSHYTEVFPLLELFEFPAVFSLVGSWLEAESDPARDLDPSSAPREFLDRDQVREIASSGLVEFASHSYDLHRGVLGNPQGNLQPAALTRRYDPTSGSYETETEYRDRIRRDLARSAETIQEWTGQRPRLVTWPYGAWSPVVDEIAAEVGMESSLALDSGVNPLGRTRGIKRLLMSENPSLGSFVYFLRHPAKRDPTRVIEIAMDDLYDPDPDETERRLGDLVQRLHSLQVSAVYLEALSDADGDGRPDQAYHPNDVLPLRADLLNRVAWQLRTRSGVKVHLRLPIGGHQPAREGGADPFLNSRNQNHRLRIRSIFEDLARYVPADGLVLRLGPEVKGAWGSIPPLQERREFAADLHRATSSYRGDLRWTEEASPGGLPRDSEDASAWASEILGGLEAADQVAVRVGDAAGRVEVARRLRIALRALEGVSAGEDLPNRTVFLLPGSSAHGRRAEVRASNLEHWTRLLLRGGAPHFGYEPDRLLSDRSEVEAIRPFVSIANYPHRRP